MCVWFFEGYLYFASVLAGLTFIMIGIQLYQTRSNLYKIKRQAHCSCPVRVLRNNRFNDIDSAELIPGDVIEIPE